MAVYVLIDILCFVDEEIKLDSTKKAINNLVMAESRENTACTTTLRSSVSQ